MWPTRMTDTAWHYGPICLFNIHNNCTGMEHQIAATCVLKILKSKSLEAGLWWGQNWWSYGLTREVEATHGSQCHVTTRCRGTLPLAVWGLASLTPAGVRVWLRETMGCELWGVNLQTWCHLAGTYCAYLWRHQVIRCSSLIYFWLSPDPIFDDRSSTSILCG